MEFAMTPVVHQSANGKWSMTIVESVESLEVDRFYEDKEQFVLTSKTENDVWDYLTSGGITPLHLFPTYEDACDAAWNASNRLVEVSKPMQLARVLLYNTTTKAVYVFRLVPLMSPISGTVESHNTYIPLPPTIHRCSAAGRCPCCSADFSLTSLTALQRTFKDETVFRELVRLQEVAKKTIMSVQDISIPYESTDDDEPH